MRIDWQYDLYFSEDIIGYPNYAAEVVPPQVAVWSYFDGEVYEQALSGQVALSMPELLDDGGGGYIYDRHKKRFIREEEEIMTVIMAFLCVRRH